MPYTVQTMDRRFGEYLLLPRERQLRGPHGVVELGDRSYDVLVALLERSGQIVSKQDLMDAVWPGIAVEENTLQVHVSTLRKALGPSLIQTVHGRGYRYVGPDPDPAGLSAMNHGKQLFRDPAVPESDRKTTSLAVLPFSTTSDDGDQQLLADGLAEDLIIELARYRHLTVIGHRLSSHYREPGTARNEIWRDLDVDFVVGGSVRTGTGSIRVAVQLVDAETGTVAWGDRFSCDPGDVFSVQDEIVAAVVARLAINLDAAAEKQRSRDPTSSGSAYVQFLQARSHWRNGAPVRALACALKAIEMDPGYGRARAYAAFFYAYDRFGQWFAGTAAEHDASATREIELALAADPTDPFILQRASMTYLMLGNPEAALRYAEAAAAESAVDSEILVIRGLSLACAGHKAEGAALLERAIALEPRLPPGCYSALAEVRHMQHDYLASQAALDKMANPPFYFRLLEAANLARIGETEAASSIVESFPDSFDCELFARSEAKMCALTEDAEHWLESFRLAGIHV